MTSRRPWVSLQSFGERRVVVVGEAILDRTLEGRAAGLCREAPVPVAGLETVQEAPEGWLMSPI